MKLKKAEALKRIIDTIEYGITDGIENAEEPHIGCSGRPY